MFLFLSRNKKSNVYPCKPQFKGVNIIYTCFPDVFLFLHLFILFIYTIFQEDCIYT